MLIICEFIRNSCSISLHKEGRKMGGNEGQKRTELGKRWMEGLLGVGEIEGSD